MMIGDPEGFFDAYGAEYLAKYGEEYRDAMIDAIYMATQSSTFNPATFNWSKCFASAVFMRSIMPREQWPAPRPKVKQSERKSDIPPEFVRDIEQFNRAASVVSDLAQRMKKKLRFR